MEASLFIYVYNIIGVYIYIYTYVMVDLKVLVRSLNCESRAFCVGNHCESFFEFAKDNFVFAKISRKFRESWIL